MENSIRNTLVITFTSTLGFLVLLAAFAWARENQIMLSADRLEYSKLYVQAFNVIVVSFFVGLLAVLVPARLREVKYNFDRLKESRVAYSEAKTGVAYLPVRLCDLNYGEAAAFVQHVHFHKHQAELYEELERHVQHLEISAREWADEMYDYLAGFRDLLERRAADWDVLTRGDRMRLLLEARSSVDKQLIDAKKQKEAAKAAAKTVAIS